MLRYARNDGVEAAKRYRQDNPASIVVQKPQCSGASIGAPAWASNRKIATVKTISAEEKRTMRLRMWDAFNRHRGRMMAPPHAETAAVCDP